MSDFRLFRPTVVTTATVAARSQFAGYRIAAIVPCHNEQAAVGKVVRDLITHLPEATVYVYDNCSTDDTVAVARAAGAVVRTEELKGKGNVVRRAFADIDADVYLLIDGDDTYDAAAAPAMVEALIEGPYDHVLGIREPEATTTEAYRPGHERGNVVLNSIVGRIFGSNAVDMLSGYRVFSRRFVKSFPAVSREFEIETELTVHSLALRLPASAVRIGFRDRAEGSESKLRTYRDGWKILKLILSLARHERPIAFYSLLSGLFVAAALGFAAPVAVEYVATGLVPRLPSMLVSLALLGLAILFAALGLVLDGTRKARHESSRLAYLRFAALGADRADRADRHQPAVVHRRADDHREVRVELSERVDNGPVGVVTATVTGPEPAEAS